jgi:hypothetical protein
MLHCGVQIAGAVEILADQATPCPAVCVDVAPAAQL